MSGSVYMQVVLQSFSGINTSSPIDNTGTPSTSIASNTITANSVTVNNSGAWELIGTAGIGDPTAANFTGLSNYSCGATLLYDTTPLNPISTGSVTVTGDGPAANNEFVAVPFTIAPAATAVVPPTVESETPTSNATDVNVSTPVTATFSEAVQSGTISFTLTNSSGSAVAGSVSYNSTTNLTTFTPSSALAYNTTYTATSSGAQSTSGVTMRAPFSWSFTTDAAPPSVTSETPASGAAGVALSTTATATFNEAVQAGTISFTLTNSSGSSEAATVTYNSSNNTATLTPSAALAYSTTYTATVSGATDSAGDPMSAPFSWSFTTAAAVAPTVTSETPTSGATNVALSTAPTASFNEAVQSSPISFTLTNSSGSSVAGSVSYNSTTYITTFTPTSALAYNTTYTATISGAQSTSGVTMSVPFSWSFTTDAAPPSVTSETPASGATGVAVTTTATATFNEAVQSGTIGFTLTTSSGSVVSGAVAYNSSNNTVTLTPSTALAYDTTYTATVSGAKDSAGDPMTSPFSWSFTTASASTNPIAVVPNGSVTYNTTDQSSQTVTLPSGTVAGDLAVAVITWNTSQTGRISSAPTGWSTVAQNVISQNGNYEGASVYYRVIQSGDSSWNFTMNGSVYMQVVLQSFSGINTSSPIDNTGTTSTSSASDTITANSVTVNNSGAWELIGIAQGQETNATATNFTGLSNYSYGATLLYDTTPLNPGATGTVTVTGGGTAATNELAAIPFTIAPAATTPPTVTSETPASNATEVSVSTTATATFNEAVQASTISFTLKNSSGTAVGGSVSYNSTTNTTTFTPSSALACNTTYTATVSAQSTSGVSVTAPFSWSFTTDPPAPTVTGESPASGATNVAVSTTATATFSEAVQSSTISFTLNNSSGSSVAASVSYNSATYTATLTPSSALAYNTTYTATVSSGENSAGVPMSSSFTWSFTTDAAPPSVTSESPASGATGVAVSSPVTATFNEAVQSSTISFTLTNSAGTSVPAAVSYNSSNYTVTLTPSSALAYGTTYTATVSGARDTAGDPMSGPVTWSFTTDAAQPAVASYTPASGAIGVAVSSPVTATFNEAVQSSTISFTLTNSAGTSVPAAVSYNSSNYAVTLTPSSALAFGTTYTATVSGAKDTSGDPMSGPVTWSFTTDKVQPAVTSYTPASGAIGVAVSSPVTATFNEAVQSNTISFTLTNNAGTSVPATVSYNSSNNTVTLTPSSALAYGTTYTATVSGAKDTAGDPLAAPVSWSFTTDAVQPAVASHTPLSGATGVAVSSPVTATFNEAVQSSTISFTLTNNAKTSVPATVSYNSSNYTVTLTPSSALAYGTTYTATVSGANDTAGDPMAAPVSWSFTTDKVQPAVASHTPLSGATGVAVSSPVTATFNEAVQSSTISFTLTNSAGTAVPAPLTYNSSTDTATFTPSAALAYGTTYTATVSGAKDTASDPMAGSVTWSFTTDASQPAVSSKTPVSGATGVAVSTPVTATFNEAVQSSTISFTLTNSLGGSVAGTVSYSSTNNTATFTPSSAFAYNTKYTAAVSGAKDSAGDPMSGPLSWSFTTASASTNPIAVVPNGSVTYNTTDESSQTVALPSGTTAGDLAVVLLTWNTSQAWRTSSAPAGWSTIAQNVIGQKGNYEGESVYYRVIQPGDSSWSFTTNAAVYMQIVLQSFSGINTSSPIDNTGTPSTSSGSDAITANSVTVKNSGAWELVGIAQAQESNATATNFTGLSNHSYGATLLSDTTALKSGATGTVTVTGGGAAANNALVAIPFTIAPAATTAPTVTTATASATPANESVSLVNTAQISNQSSSRTVQSGPIQEAVNNGGTVLAPAATGVTSAPSATLHVQSDPHGAVLASLVNDNPIGILPDTLLSALARDLLQVKQRRSVGVAHGVGDQGGLGA